MAIGESWQAGMEAQLSALHDAARLDPNPRIEDPNNPPHHPGVDLYRALFLPDRVIPRRCSVATQRARTGRGHSQQLLAIHNRRLAIARTDRPGQQPSGWRPDRHLVVDLHLLAAEGHKGLAITCPTCADTHVFERRTLHKPATNAPPERTGPPETAPPPGYADIEDAAFAEIWGPYPLDPAEAPERPEVYLHLTPTRAAALEKAIEAGLPFPIPPATLAGPAMRNPTGGGGLIPAAAADDPRHRIHEQPT